MTQALAVPIADNQAQVNITWNSQNGSLPDPVPLDATDDEILQMVTEALRGGGVTNIPADPDADLDGFVLDRCPPAEDRDFHVITLRPKVPFGHPIGDLIRDLVTEAVAQGYEKPDLVSEVSQTWDDVLEE